VFSLPKRIRVFFKYNRSLGSILFKSAWEILLELYQIVGAGIPAWTIPEPIRSNAPPDTEPRIIPYDE
jgi:hypothetical protein